MNKLKEFARMFQTKRIELGYRQVTVAQAITEQNGKVFSQAAISRFENLELSYKNSQKLKPILEKWLGEAEKQGAIHQKEKHLPTRPRNRPRKITSAAKEELEGHFHSSPKPTSKNISKIADSLRLEKEVVRVWFKNRRQREKALGTL